MSWQNDYLAALQARDQREQANRAVFDACTRDSALHCALIDIQVDTKLADRTAQLSNSKAPPERAPIEDRPARGSKTSSPVPSVSTIRADLVEAQTQRAGLQAKFDKASEDLARLTVKSKQDEQRIRELTAEKNILGARLRDRDSELKEKAKLLSDVQGEAVTLNLELNSEIEKNDKLVAENKDLVDRWMARMGQEAERMNLDSRFT